MTVRGIALAVSACVAVGSLAGCGDDGDESITLAEWVEEFDRICVDVVGRVGPDTSDEEFRRISEDALDEMRALGEPTEGAEEAATLLEVIERTTLDDEISGEQAAELDRRFLAAATAVGLSDECLGGPAG